MIVEGRARYVVLGAMSALYFLLSAGTFNALGVVLPLMVQDMGMNWAEAGFGFTLLGIACGIASLAPAMVIRKMGVSLTLVIGSLLLASGFALLAVAKGVTPYHVGTTLLGLGYCFCGTVAGVHVIGAMFERRSTALGVYFFTGGMGSVAGPLLFYGIQQVMSDWRIFWMICTLATLAIGAFAAIVTRGSKPPAPAADAPPEVITGWTAREALRTPQYWIIVGGYTAGLLVNTTVHSFVVQHMSERGLTLGVAALIVSIAALIGAGASAAAGVIGERIEARWLMLASLAGMTLASFALIIPQGWVTMGLFAVAMGVGLGFSYVAAAMLLHDFFGKRPNLELYSTMCVISTSAALGPGLGGMVRDESGNFVAVFVTLAAIGVALIVAVALMRAPVHSSEREGELAAA